jgi:HAD superfamily hydrolase (TIGR01490 family)
MQQISIFDMDRTITKAGTYTPWLWHWSGARAKWRRLLTPISVMAGMAYVSKLISRGRLKEINHSLLMGGRTSRDVATAEAEKFADLIVPDQCFADALARIEVEKAEGRRVILATASYAFYARAIASRVGVEEVVGTRVQRMKDGGLRARIAGENCYGGAKLAMVERYLAEKGLAREDAHIRVFSDHVSDAPIMEWADEAFAVNGGAAMKALAKRNGWTQLNWT